MQETFTIRIADGTIAFVHDDALVGLLNAGEAEITRASHVEPYDGSGPWPIDAAHRWVADMGPSDGPVLGPFPTRKRALRAERNWLAEHRGL